MTDEHATRTTQKNPNSILAPPHDWPPNSTRVMIEMHRHVENEPPLHIPAHRPGTKK